MSKLIAKIINAKIILGPECYSFNYIARATINILYTALYNITRLVHQIPMDDSVQFHITYQKKSISFPDHIDNILTCVEIEDMRGRPFTKFNIFDISISIILASYKISFVGKAKD